MTRMGPLTLDVNPQLKEDEHVCLAAIDDQAKLMRWHYRLGHLPFSKLKQLALNSLSAKSILAGEKLVATYSISL